MTLTKIKGVFSVVNLILLAEEEFENVVPTMASPLRRQVEKTVIRQRQTFSLAAPTAWNGLPVALRLTPLADSALFSIWS